MKSKYANSLCLLEARVEDLERVLLGNERKIGSAVDTGFRGRNAALEAEAGS
jgi:hypothetical protein